MDWQMLLIGIAGFALLAIGLFTNNMPNSVGMPSREKNPFMFWALAMTYGLIGFTFVIKSLLG